MKRKIYRGHTIPYGALSGASDELRNAYYSCGYLKDEMMPELPVLEPEDDIIDPEEIVWQKEMKQIISDTLDGIAPREAKVLRMRFGLEVKDEMTLEDIGLTLDVSRERIRQIEAKALRKLKHPQRQHVLLDAMKPKTSVEKAKEKQVNLEKMKKENDEIFRLAKIKWQKLQEEKQRNEHALKNNSAWIEILKKANPQAYQRIKTNIDSYSKNWI